MSPALEIVDDHVGMSGVVQHLFDPAHAVPVSRRMRDRVLPADSEPPPPVRARLVLLRDADARGCIAEFEREDDQTRLTTRFDIDDRDDLTTASLEAGSWFYSIGGSASEVRDVVAAAIAFWRASRPRTPTAPEK